MKHIAIFIALAASCALAAETNVQPQVIFRIATARSIFGTNGAPLHLIFRKRTKNQLGQLRVSALPRARGGHSAAQG